MENNLFEEQISDNIHSLGVIVTDDMNRLTKYGEPFVSAHYIICINHQGTVHYNYDNNELTFNPLDICVIYPNHSLIIYESSLDYNATMVMVNEELFQRLTRLNTHGSRFHIEQKPQFSLTREQYDDINTLVKALRIVTLKVSEQKKRQYSFFNGLEPKSNKLVASTPNDIILSQLFVLIETINNIRDTNEGRQGRDNTHISPRLYEALIRHCSQHRNVQFYAKLFCLTPKHFSAMVKLETGQNPSYWIQQQVAIQAKALLINEPQSTLFDIADKMGFPDLATFSRYFKRVTGFTPSEYRENKEIRKP